MGRETERMEKSEVKICLPGRKDLRFFFLENDFEWLMNVKWKIFMGLWHKKIMAFCQIDINHGQRIASYVLPFSVKKSYKFSCCHCFYFYICEAYLLIGWILLIQDSLFLTLLYTFAWKLLVLIKSKDYYGEE